MRNLREITQNNRFVLKNRILVDLIVLIETKVSFVTICAESACYEPKDSTIDLKRKGQSLPEEGI